MTPGKPAADEKIVHDALVGVLRGRGLEPRGTLVLHSSCRLARATRAHVHGGHCLPPARAALSDFLGRNASSVADYAVGVWVLDESETFGWAILSGELS